MDNNYRKSAAFALVVVALDAMAIGLVLPVLPKLVAQVSNGTPSQTAFYVGALFSIYAMMQFVFSPVVGGLSDRFGRRPVILISLLCLGINTLLWVWVQDLTLLFILRITAGLFASNVSTASAYIADVTPPDKRAGYFGLIGAMFGIGFILGPVIGGILGEYWLRLPFLAAASLIIVSAFCGFLMLPESLPPEKRRAFDLTRANPFASLRALGNAPGQWRLTFTWCCLWLTVAAHQATFILSNEFRFGWSPMQNGLILGGGGILQVFVMALLVPKATKLWGERNTALIGLLFCVITYLLFAFAAAPWILYTGIVGLALGTLATPALQAMLSADADEDRQGEVQGALSSLQAFMLAVGPLPMGVLFSLATRPGRSLQFPGAAFFAAAIVSLIALIVLGGFRTISRAKIAPEAEIAV